MHHCTLVQPEAGLDIPRQPASDVYDGFYNMTPLLWYSGVAAYGENIASHYPNIGLTVECSSSYDDIQNPKVCYTFD